MLSAYSVIIILTGTIHFQSKVSTLSGGRRTSVRQVGISSEQDQSMGHEITFPIDKVFQNEFVRVASSKMLCAQQMRPDDFDALMSGALLSSSGKTFSLSSDSSYGNCRRLL